MTRLSFAVGIWVVPSHGVYAVLMFAAKFSPGKLE
jgi:hypothetical protein